MAYELPADFEVRAVKLAQDLGVDDLVGAYQEFERAAAESAVLARVYRSELSHRLDVDGYLAGEHWVVTKGPDRAGTPKWDGAALYADLRRRGVPDAVIGTIVQEIPPEPPQPTYKVDTRAAKRFASTPPGAGILEHLTQTPRPGELEIRPTAFRVNEDGEIVE